MSSSFVRERATVRSPHYMGIVAYLVAAAILAGVGTALGLTAPLAILPLSISPAILAFLARSFRVRELPLRATLEGVTLAGEFAMPRDKIRHRLVFQEDGATWVRLQGLTSLDVKVESEAEGNELLRALKLDARSTTTTFHLASKDAISTVIAVTFAVVFTMALLGGLAAFWKLPYLVYFALAPTLAVMLAVARSATATLVVGADGVRVRDGWKRAQFLPHDANVTAR